MPNTLQNLWNLKIYIMKQDIHIYAAYSRPNGWTEWADIFCRHSWVAGGCFGLKIIGFFQNFNLFFNFFYSYFFLRSTPGLQLLFYKKDQIFLNSGRNNNPGGSSTGWAAVLGAVSLSCWRICSWTSRYKNWNDSRLPLSFN